MTKKKDEKKKEETALVVPEKRKLEAEVVLYSGSPEISAELEKAQTLSAHDFYKVGNKTVPSARALQWLANRKQVKTQIVDIRSDKDYCRAVIGGWIGNNPDPKSNPIYKEATVEMIFEIELAEKLLDFTTKFNMKKGEDWKVNEDTGMPYLVNPRFQAKMMKEMLRLRKFALRTVVTKAERIIHSKLADVEWRDEDEMRDEQNEVELVSGKPAKTGTKKDTKQMKRTKEGIKEVPQDDDSGVVDADYEAVPDEPDEPTDMEKFIKKVKDSEVVTKKMKPREALEAIDDAAFPNYVEQYKEMVLDVSPNFFEENLERFQIPESSCKALVKKATGISLKLCEKKSECKIGKCNNKLTEPEAEEHDDLCNEHWKEQNE